MIQTNQRGMVSIVVVMFTSILLMIVSTSFINIMVQEETQANNNNLSRMAYESATAGVEDGKRVINACAKGNSDACAAIAANECNTVSAANVAGSVSDTSTTIKSGSNAVNISGQAYTCVKIQQNTLDVEYNLKEGVSKIIPLKTTGETSKILLQWTLKSDSNSAIVNTPNDGGANSFPKKSAWPVNAPAVVRAQIVVPEGDSIQGLQEFDTSSVSTVFLRPYGISANRNYVNSVNAYSARAANNPVNATASASVVTCSAEAFDANLYACSAMLEFSPRSVKARSNVAFIRLTSIYNDTNVKLSFADESIRFEGVQPKIDSTGRASDVYRRVSSRVSLDSSFSYPEYAVDITGSLCKDFSVTEQSVRQGDCSVKPQS